MQGFRIGLGLGWLQGESLNPDLGVSEFRGYLLRGSYLEGNPTAWGSTLRVSLCSEAPT